MTGSGHASDSGPRTFLFLQGPSSAIFALTADRLEAMGHRCLRVNLCVGDWIFWRRAGAINFRGRLEDWPDYVARLFDRERITDIVLLGDERPHHRAAIALARQRGISVSVVEMGYLRPDWITIEREGIGSNSRFPTDPETILRAATRVPEPDFRRLYTQTFVADAASDLLFNLPNVFLWPFFPHYRWHALFHPLAEYCGWLRRLAGSKARTRRADRTIERLTGQKTPFFTVPLQLETDYQLRAHSCFESQRDAISLIIQSFAENAPTQAEILFKVHPLDNSLIDWERHIRVHASRAGIDARVHVIDGGDLERLLQATRGVVTVNSTVGLQALRQSVSVKTLGVAIYDIAGLTHRGSLDGFWRDPAAPDPVLRDAFIRLMAATIQVRGNFYSRDGAQAGAAAIAARLDSRTVNEPGGFVDPAPRARPTKIGMSRDVSA